MTRVQVYDPFAASGIDDLFRGFFAPAKACSSFCSFTCDPSAPPMATAPWFTFVLHGRVPSTAFHPRPGVDGGIIHIIRRPTPLVPVVKRQAYERFVRAIFTGRGGSLERIVQQATQLGLFGVGISSDFGQSPSQAGTPQGVTPKLIQCWRRKRWTGLQGGGNDQCSDGGRTQRLQRMLCIRYGLPVR